MARTIIAVIAGLFAGFVAIVLILTVSMLIYPLPDGLDINDEEALREYAKSLPVGAFLFAIASHASGALVGGFVCSAIVRRPRVVGSLIVGTLFLAAGIMNLLSLPHPVWFAVVDLVLYLPCSVIGGVMGGTLFCLARAEAPAEE